MLVIYTGLAVIAVGLIFMLVGLFVALQEYKRRGLLGNGTAKFIDSLAKLVQVLADKPLSLKLFAFGTLLVFIGGTIAGVGGLTH